MVVKKQIVITLSEQEAARLSQLLRFADPTVIKAHGIDWSEVGQLLREILDQLYGSDK